MLIKLSYLLYNINMRTTEKVLISSITTMRIGGVAKYVVEVEQPNEVVEAVEFAEF